MKSESFQPARQDAARQYRAEQPEQRRVPRMRATGQQQRSQPRTEERPDREADDREHSHDEALDVAVEREQHTEHDDQPVDRGH